MMMMMLHFVTETLFMNVDCVNVSQINVMQHLTQCPSHKAYLE